MLRHHATLDRVGRIPKEASVQDVKVLMMDEIVPLIAPLRQQAQHHPGMGLSVIAHSGFLSEIRGIDVFE